MSESDKTQELLELFKYFKAEDLKNEQTQLTKTANKVRDTANGRLRALFTDEEQQTLLQAATLLRSLKSRVEHAKEIKAREEARKAKELKDSIAAARNVVNEAFPDSEGIVARTTLLLWTLVLDTYMTGYGGHHENYRSNHPCWHNVPTGQLANSLTKWFDAADVWQTQHTQNGKLVYSREELKNSPDFITTAAFFNEVRHRLADILESELDSYKPGFAQRFDELVKKTEERRASLRTEKASFLAHFEERLKAYAAGQQFINTLHASISKA